jgi:hypothetical protein
MSKLNKLYITIQIILITVIYFTIPNSLILQLVLWVNLFFTTFTLSFAEATDEELVALEKNTKVSLNNIAYEIARLDTLVDELKTPKKKSTTKKTTKK